jgi:2-polyprenyl-6-methoxyphenol hydroxylase-like FAD-dependent oxidoreductase
LGQLRLAGYVADSVMYELTGFSPSDALKASGAPVRLGVTVSSLRQSLNAVEVEFPDGTQDIYDLVMGADGTNSNIREPVFGAHIKPEFMGQAVSRAMVERPPEIQGATFFSVHETRQDSTQFRKPRCISSLFRTSPIIHESRRSSYPR